MASLISDKINLYVVVLFILISSLILWQLLLKLTQQAKSAKAHGCQSPIFERAPFPINIKKAIDLVRNYQNYTLLTYFHNLFRIYGGTYISRVLWLDIVITSDPENIKHILQQRFWDFDIGPLRRPLFLPVTPHGVFNLDGEEWRTVRKILRIHLAESRSRADLEILETLFQSMIQRIQRSGDCVDMQDVFSALVMDYLSFFSVGQPLGALSKHQNKNDREIEEAFQYIKASIARFGQSGPMSWVYGRSRFRRACKLIQGYTGTFTRQAMERSQEQKAAGESLSFVEAAARDGYSFNDIRDQAISLYFAGDATSSLLSGTFWFLARNPHVLDRLKREILENFGLQAPTFGDLGTIVYLRYIFNEVMRLVPSVPFNAKVANRDTWLPRGGGEDGQSSIFVRRGQIVSWCAWSCHRRVEIFGKDADEFHPERWEHIKRDTIGYIPFQPGPRVCPGQSLAITMASYITIRMLQTFQSVETRDLEPWKDFIELGLTNKNGVLLSFT